MKYAIVTETDPKTLANGVAALIKEGWEPQGGIAFGQYHFMQAMVRKEPNSKLQTPNSKVTARMEDIESLLTVQTVPGVIGNLKIVLPYVLTADVQSPVVFWLEYHKCEDVDALQEHIEKAVKTKPKPHPKQTIETFMSLPKMEIAGDVVSYKAVAARRKSQRYGYARIGDGYFWTVLPE